jgi:hypothetical protein
MMFIVSKCYCQVNNGRTKKEGMPLSGHALLTLILYRKDYFWTFASSTIAL